MRLQSLKVIASLWMAAALAVGCGGGSSAPAPTNLTAVATESTVTLNWDATPGVEYWVFYAPTVFAPKDNSNMSRWFNLLGGAVQLNVKPPFVVSGLANANSYSFTVNGRTGGGPGGPAAPTVTATPRLAGGTWTVATTPASTQDLRAVAYVGSYVAVGTGGAILSSPDAKTWTAQTSATTQTLNGVAYYVSNVTTNSVTTSVTNQIAVGDAGTVVTSTDGLTWTARASGTTQNLNAIAANGILSVVVGAGGTILTSTDSVTWKPATSSGTTQDLYAVSYLNASWFAAGANGTLLKSTDGQTWTPVATGSTADLRGISFGSNASSTATANSYVLVGSGGTVVTSADGVTWTSQVLPGASTLNAIAYGGQFVVVGNGGKIFSSTDGLTWTAATLSGTSGDLLAVVRGAGMLSATGKAGTHLTSN